MTDRDLDLERLLADTDAELPPPPATAPLDLPGLATRRTRRRGLAAVLVLGVLASAWSLHSASTAAVATAGTHGEPPLASEARALAAALSRLELRLHRSTATAAARARERDAAAHRRECDTRVRSELAAVRADTALAFTAPFRKPASPQETKR